MGRILGVVGFPGLTAGFLVFLARRAVIWSPAMIVLVDAEAVLVGCGGLARSALLRGAVLGTCLL